METSMGEVERFQLSRDGAQQYEEGTVTRLMRPHTEAIIKHVSLHAGDRVLDVACGTGIVTRVAVTQFPNLASIVGVDLNPNMLEIARAHTPTTSVPVEWQESDICALPFPDDSFDVVICQQGLQYVPDKRAAFRDIHRVLVPGGRLIFTVWSRPHRNGAALAEALTRHVHADAGRACLAPFAWSDADAIRTAVDEAGFRGIAMQLIESTTRRASSETAIRAHIEEITSRAAFAPFADAIAAALPTLVQDVSATMQVYRIGDEFVATSQAHLVEAQAA
jgi:ubiquinone/menaquinone biosynthesis C-methylase UbiE